MVNSPPAPARSFCGELSANVPSARLSYAQARPGTRRARSVWKWLTGMPSGLKMFASANSANGVPVARSIASASMAYPELE